MKPHSIYMDNHATTRVDPRVFGAMRPWWSESYGNAASVSHSFGREAADAVNEARERIATALNCSPVEIVFTSGATESDNLALKGVLQAHAQNGGLVVNAAEHRAVLDPARRLRRDGTLLTIVPVDDLGRVAPEAVFDALAERTRLVSVMLANNEVGAVNRVREIAEGCRERGVLVHCDASQAIGRMPVDLAELPVDLLSFTAHKLYGPKGVGALFVRKRDPAIPIRPLLDGGGHEHGLRSGTVPTPLVVGFAEAISIAAAECQSEMERLRGLRDRLLAGITHELDGVVLHGDQTDRLAGNLNLGFQGVNGDALMTEVAARGLAVSSGSACTSANPEPSHVLRAMGVPERLARASLRFGLGRFNTEQEVADATAIVVEVVRTLRSRSVRPA